MANGETGQIGYWKFSWGGQILSSWKPGFPTFFDGTLGVRNGVVFIYSGSKRTLFAVNETTTKVIWNATDLVTSTNPYSNNPLEWNEDDSILYLSTANQIHAINATNGNIIWSTQPMASQTAISPLIRSTLDNTFVVKYYNNTVSKYKITDGQLVWRTNLDGGEWNTPSPPAVDNADGSIYCTTWRSGVYKLDINGNIVWSQTDSAGWFHYHSPLLFNSEYVMVPGTLGGIKLYSKSTGDSHDVFTYGFDYANNVVMQVFTQPLLNKEKNVLYIVYFTTASLLALDTSNVNNFTLMWSVDTLLTKHSGSGPSIASDGTIFMATATRDYPVGLVSIGCPITKQLSSDGMSCVCAPVFVASGDSCVCSDDTKEPSEDGLSCVDKPLVPGVSSPSTSSSPSSPVTPAGANTPAGNKTPNSSIASNAVAVGVNLIVAVALITLLL